MILSAGALPSGSILDMNGNLMNSEFRSDLLYKFGLQDNGDIVDLNGRVITSDDRFDILEKVDNLPINDYITQIQDAVSDAIITIISAETGSGKTTQVPKILFQAPHIKVKQLTVTEPRVIAAIGAANRVSQELLISTLDPSFSIGHRVGYRTGKEKLSSKDSELLFVTDGLQLLRQFVSGIHPDILIVDEAHTYGVPIEFLLAQVKRIMTLTKRKIKLVIMSATIDSDLVSGLYKDISQNIPVLEIPGRTFPVEKHFKGQNEFIPSIVELARQDKNILVFVDGKKEIDNTINKLKGYLPNYNIVPLHSELPIAEQRQILQKPDKPTIIVATNIAQESITIDYINAVVDNGYCKTLKVNPNGVPELFREPISQADSLQRAGRAGRVMEGEYIRANRIPFEELDKFPVGEIENLTLERYILIALSMGFDPKKELRTGKKVFIHNPNKDLLKLTYENLRKIGAIDKDNHLTELGKELLNLPLDPHVGIMLLNGIKRNCAGNMIDICAIMNHNGFIGKGEKWKDFVKGKYKLDSDLIALSEFLKFVSTRETLSLDIFNSLKKAGVSDRELRLYQEYSKNGKEYMLFEIVDLSILGIKTKRIYEILNTRETLKERLKESNFEIANREYKEYNGKDITIKKTNSDNNIKLTDDIVKSILSGMMDSVFVWDNKTKMFYDKKKGGFGKPINSCMKDFSKNSFYAGYPFIIGSSHEDNEEDFEECSTDKSSCTPLLFFITKVNEQQIEEVGHAYMKEVCKDIEFKTQDAGRTKRGKVKLRPKIIANMRKDLGGFNLSNIIAEIPQDKLEDAISFSWLPEFLIENNLSIKKFLKSFGKGQKFNIDRFRQILTLFTPSLFSRFYMNNIPKTINGFIHDSSVFEGLINSTDPRVKEFLKDPYRKSYEDDILLQIKANKGKQKELMEDLNRIKEENIEKIAEVTEIQVERQELKELKEITRGKQEKDKFRKKNVKKEVKLNEMRKKIKEFKERVKDMNFSKVVIARLVKDIEKEYGVFRSEKKPKIQTLQEGDVSKNIGRKEKKVMVKKVKIKKSKKIKPAKPVNLERLEQRRLKNEKRMQDFNEKLKRLEEERLKKKGEENPKK